jgi:hypothetical protein
MYIFHQYIQLIMNWRSPLLDELFILLNSIIWNISFIILISAEV